MGALLISGIAEDISDSEHTFIIGMFCRDRIAAAGLAFAGKSAHQILFCSALGKLTAMAAPPFYLKSMPREAQNILCFS